MSSPLSRGQVMDTQRARIHEATMQILAERGMRGATVARVIARAGVSRSTFYALFEDLESCILAAVQQVLSQSAGRMSAAFERESIWQDGVLAAVAALLISLDREPLLARVCLVESLAGSSDVLRHRARVLATLNPMVAMGREQVQTLQGSELAAEASVAAVAGILHNRLVNEEAPPFISLLGELVGLVVTPYLDPATVLREKERADDMARALAEECLSKAPSLLANAQIPAGLRRPGAYRARSCIIFLATNPGSSNKAVAAGIGVSHLGQVSGLLARLANAGLLVKQSSGAGRPNASRLTVLGESVAEALNDTLVNDCRDSTQSSRCTDCSYR